LGRLVGESLSYFNFGCIPAAQLATAGAAAFAGARLCCAVHAQLWPLELYSTGLDRGIWINASQLLATLQRGVRMLKRI